LTGLRKLVVGDRQYRIVFKVEADGTVTVVWVIATRNDDECYNLALARLKLYENTEKAALVKALIDSVYPNPPQK
jgi:mRNA interferase RelE/StbE